MKRLSPVIQTLIKTEFPKTSDLIFLNSGSVSKTPVSLTKKLFELHERRFENPTKWLFGLWEKMWVAQKALAPFYNSSPYDLFLRNNITQVIDQFIIGLPLSKGKSIAIGNLEYGAVINTCRHKAEREDREMYTIHTPASRPELDHLKRTTSNTHAGENDLAIQITNCIINQLKPDTGLLVLSHVITNTGFILPIEDIGNECRKRNILFLVDGAHAAGSIPIDFNKLENFVDFYGANLHKWMMGPTGTAFGWVNPKHKDLPWTYLNAGWTTHDIPSPFAGFGDGRLHTARLLMSATDDHDRFFLIPDLIEMWRTWGGIAAVSNYQRNLLNHIETRMQETLNWAPLSPMKDQLNFQGPLSAYEMPEVFSRLGYLFAHRLRDEHGLQITVAPILKFTGKPNSQLAQGLSTESQKSSFVLRFSPSLYNNEHEIDRAFDILSSFVKTNL